MLGKTKKGEPVFLIRLGNLEKKNLKVEDLARITFYLCEESLRILKPPTLSVVAIVDFRHSHNWSIMYSAELKEKLVSPVGLVYPGFEMR